jgi:hypothetical protein
VPRPLVVVGSLLVALALAGCGADDVPEDDVAEATYEQQVRAAAEVIWAAGDRLAPEASPDGMAEQVDETAFDLRQAATRLEEADPPDELAEEHDRLRSALDRAAAEADALAESIPESGEEPDPQLTEALADALREADEAVAALEERGLDVRRRT